VVIAAVVAIGALALLLVFAVVAVYNELVRRRAAVDDAWARLDAQLRRRHALVPDLVDTVRGHARHERRTLVDVTAARAEAIGARTAAERVSAENALTGALDSLLAVTDSCAALTAGQFFAALREEVAAAENRIARARRHYDDAAVAYNRAVRTVPVNIVAGMSGFGPREHFRPPGR
jgi:LemA protein